MAALAKLLHLHASDLWLVLRAAVLFGLSLAAIRVMGKRTIGQLSPFDLLVIIILGSAVVIPMEDEKTPFTHGLIPLAMIAALNYLISKVILRSRRIENFLQGKPSILIENGEVVTKNLQKERVSMADLLIMLREKNVTNIEDVQEAVLEPNGQLSVILKPERQPLTPKDLGLSTTPGLNPTVLVENGEVVYANLDKVRLGLGHVVRELGSKGVERLTQVKRATLDELGQLTVEREKGGER
ncbi:MAG TPA: DUF421 domain-containing protein [Firmicutes bacterium]|nr:DUF421 domain-containing protein [Bacillota bacterium]